ncbi:MAG: 50S ribosomal protein L5 [Alphaproteobacteria bacterium 43-37]|nr:MAG: 50S ribosomal protein L5 [Alphaproteobacteria bacterium 43-37]
MSRLRELYKTKIQTELQGTLELTNKHAVPKIEKIILNMGVGEAVQDSKYITKAVEELAAISGQKPCVTKAKKSIAGFKVREGMNLGVKVTLRKAKMFEFLDRLVNIALPRIKDFRGLSSKSFDGRGNFTFGVKEQIIFPEIDYDKVDKIRGMDITIVTSATQDDQALALLKAFNMPFNK